MPIGGGWTVTGESRGLVACHHGAVSMDVAISVLIGLAVAGAGVLLLILAASAIPLVALLGRGSEAASTVIGVLVIVELALWLLMLLLTVYRWILPLWMYPAWLRETRRAEVEHLKAHRGHLR